MYRLSVASVLYITILTSNGQRPMMMMMKLPILPCAEKLESSFCLPHQKHEITWTKKRLSDLALSCSGTRVPECQKLKMQVRPGWQVRYDFITKSLLSQICLSVVCNVGAPYSGLKLSAVFLHRCVPCPSSDLRAKCHGDRPRETPASKALNTGGVTKQSDFGPVEGYIS